MSTCTLAGALVALCLLMCALPACAADDATLFRVFLKDASSLVSYGEIARVDDRVVFSMPIGTGSNPPSSLRLVNIAADRVDWDRTDRYAVSARSGRYIETQAEIDYTELSNRMAQALNEVGQTSDVAKPLGIVHH